ncbi:MAG: SRPBCC family protein [Bacteroidales bacterium]|nr:SRPBCC family protein [Bacteroidales bacterium]
MLKIESRIGKIDHSDEHIFNFLADFSHFSSVIPRDRMKNWEATRDTCRFTLDGLGDMGMKIVEREPYKLIKVTGDETSKFGFFFWVQLKRISDLDTRIKLTIHAEINPMVQMMAKKPLQKFLDLMVDQLENYFRQNYGEKPQPG